MNLITRPKNLEGKKLFLTTQEQPGARVRLNIFHNFESISFLFCELPEDFARFSAGVLVLFSLVSSSIRSFLLPPSHPASLCSNARAEVERPVTSPLQSSKCE